MGKILNVLIILTPSISRFDECVLCSDKTSEHDYIWAKVDESLPHWHLGLDPGRSFNRGGRVGHWSIQLARAFYLFWHGPFINFILIVSYHSRTQLTAYITLIKYISWFISSVRSSNSHLDLLVTHRFFRSHRVSILDFHFLSHYSYIKGNHWTHLLATCIPYGYNRTSLQDSAR